MPVYAMWLFGMGRCDDCQACIYLRFTLFTCSSGSCEGIVFGIVSSPLSACLCRRTFYRPTNWGRVGWGGVGCHSSVLQDMMRCYATHGVGWGGLWYHSSVLQDMMRCYATHGVGWGWVVIPFVSTARHDAMLRYAWGGVGWVVICCDTIRQYCKTWCGVDGNWK